MAAEEIHILHVDDEPDLTDVTATFLERENNRFSVETATSASEGLDRLAANDFDCIVSDYQMPGQNGIEFLETLREENPDLPFILYTGKGSEEVASDAFSAGATEYLQKGYGNDQYELLANRILNAVEKHRTHQRAVEIERISTIVSEVNQALVRASTRVQAETRVCEHITDADPYRFAWIGEIDSETDRIEPRAWAGVEEDYLDDITVTDDDTVSGHGPGGTAIRERRVAVAQNVQKEPEFEPWREEALERGYQAVAAVPLEYKDTLYGALGVYADRPDAFDEDERALLEELGADLGHAIHGFEQRRNRELFKKAATHAGHAVYITDGDGTIEYVNPEFETITGYSAEEAVGRNPRILKSGEMSDTYYEGLWESLLDGNVWEEEVVNRRQNGDLYYAHQTIAPILDENDEIDGFVAVQQDITDRKEQEETLKRRTQAIDEAPVGITISDPDQVDNPMIYVNDAFVEITGYPREESLGENCRFLQGEHTDPEAVARIREAIDAGEPVSIDLRNYRKDGSEFWNHVEIAPVTNDAGEVINHVGYQRDITERKKREQAIERLHRTTRTLMDAETDKEIGNIVVDTLQNMLDMPFSGVHLYDESEGGLVPVAWTNRTEDLVRELVTFAPGEGIAGTVFESGEGQIHDDISTVSDRYSLETNVRSQITLPLGDHGILIIGSPTPDVFDDTDVELARILAKQTVSALDRVDREQDLQHQTKRLKKFANVVSHDLRNPLQVAQARLNLARDSCDSDHHEHVEKAHERMETLIDDLLTLARTENQIDEMETLDLAAVTEKCWGTVKTEDATLVIETGRDIRADQSRLKQLLENLFSNAIEHAGKEVTITVNDLDDRNGFYVSDDGPGIPSKECEDVFKAGYSTADEGTGLGLNIVQEITHAHGWNITVIDSEAGGARFEITGVETVGE